MISDSPAPGDDRPIPESGSILLRDVLCPHCLRTDGHAPECPEFVMPKPNLRLTIRGARDIERLRESVSQLRAELDRLMAELEAAGRRE
jgi:hypothetical protein